MPQVAAIAAQWIASAITPLIAGATAEGSAYLASYIAVESVALSAASVAVTAAEVWALGEVSNLLNPPPKLNTGGSPIDWKADPQAPVPYVIGRTGTSGNIVFADVAGDKNKYITYATVLSLGPVKSIGGFKANDVLTAFTSDAGEGAGSGQQTTSLTADASAGSSVIPVSSTAGFLKGQNVSVGGQSATIANVYAAANEIELTAPLSGGASLGASVIGPSTSSFYKNRMWWKASLGPRPQSSALAWTATGTKDTPADHGGQPSTWSASAKLSGLAHTLWTLEYATETYTTGTPKPIQTVEGVYCYDPRLDSTYPGGSGSCRSNDETTWVYSENPYIHALTWLIGRSANGVRTMGVHAPISCIDVAAYVAGANVADANGWRVGGVVSSTDSKWDVLKAILIAGAGAPVKRGAMISCVVSTPQTSLDTLTAADVVGEVSVPATASRRTRINAVWPRYREESQDWQVVPTQAPVVVADYVTADGEQRTREVEYNLVQDPDQVATLARYDIENAREIGPIVLPCKPRWMGYRPGDCITVNEPEYGLNGQKVVIINRNVDPATMIATLTVRTETDGKHPFALGQTGSPPPSPALTSIDPAVVVAPSSADWSAAGGVFSSSAGSLPQITITGACPDPTIASVIFGYRLNSTGSSAANFNEVAISSVTGVFAQPIVGLAPGTSYIPIVQYRSVRGPLSAPTELAAVTTGGVAAGSATSVPWTGVTGAGKPSDNATVGATVGNSTSNLSSDGYNGAPATLHITDTYTPFGIAFGFSGQKSLATRDSIDLTFVTDAARVLAPGRNLLKNSTGTLGMKFWSGAAGWQGVFGAFGEGYYIVRSMAAGATVSYEQQVQSVAVGAGVALTLSGKAYKNLASGSVYIVAQAFDASNNNLGTIAQCNAPFGQGVFSDMTPATGTTPAGTARVDVYLVLSAATAPSANSGGVAFQQVKLELGAARTPWDHAVDQPTLYGVDFSFGSDSVRDGATLFSRTQIVTGEGQSLSFQGQKTGATTQITRSSSAPSSPATGDIWIDTSATPNLVKTWSGSAWTSGTPVNTNQLTDGAGLGTTATWSGVTGSGKPADNATVGAVWGSNLTGRPANLAALVGSEAVDNAILSSALTGGSVVPYVASTFTGQKTGSTTQITRASSAPGSPATGDIWIDTSATPNLVKTWSGSAWTSGTPTNTSQLTDGAGLGTTATWSGVTGSGKPADNATVGAVWSSNLTGRPANLAALAGTEAVDNAILSSALTGGSVIPYQSSTFTGQKALATKDNIDLTYVTDASRVLAPGRNLVKNSTGALGMKFWTGAAGWQGVFGSFGEGNYIVRVMAANETVSYEQQVQSVAIGGGIPLTLSAKAYKNLASGSVYVVAQAFDASNNSLGTVAQCNAPFGQGVFSDMTPSSGTTPSGTARVDVILVLASATATSSGGGVAFQQVKLELGTARTPWDHAVDQPALYGVDFSTGSDSVRDGATLFSRTQIVTGEGQSLSFQGQKTGATTQITRSSSAPSSPATGDIWIDTSATPNLVKTWSGSAWTSGTPVNTNQLTDGAGLGTTATWSGVTGSGKPADNATVGAAWGSNLTGRPSNLAALAGTETVDNAILSSALTGGSVVPYVASTFTGQKTGSTTQITRASSAPGSPATGDIWIDTSATPNLVKTWSGSAWTSGTPTNTNQLTDGAGLGTTATWSGVTGSGKPADNATVGAAWGANLTGRPSNLAALAGTETVDNAILSSALTGGSVIPYQSSTFTGQKALATQDTITTANLFLTDPANQLIDIGFVDAGAWGLYNGAVYDTSSNVTTTLKASKGIKFPSTGATSQAQSVANNIGPGGVYSFICEGGKSYRIALKTLQTVGFNGWLYIGLNVYDYGGNYLQTSSIFAAVDHRSAPVSGSDLQENFAGIVDMPTNAYYVAVQIGVLWPSGASAGNAYVAAPRIARAVTNDTIRANAVRLGSHLANAAGSTTLGDTDVITNQGQAGSVVGQKTGATTQITRSTSAPSSPATGDIWIDTSATPNLVKTWSGAAWTSGTPTSYTHLTDTGALAGKSNVGSADILSGAVGNEWHSEYNPTYTTGGVTYQVAGVHNLGSGASLPQEFASVAQTFSGQLMEIEVYVEVYAGTNPTFSIILDGTSSSGVLSGGTNLTGLIAPGSGGAVRYQGSTNSGAQVQYSAGRYTLFYAPSAGSHRISLALNQGDSATSVGRRWIHVRDYNAPVAKATAGTYFG